MTKAQKIFNKLDAMNLSERARKIIETTDHCAIEIFEDCETAEEVEELIAENFGDE